MCNATAVDASGLPCCSGGHRADPLDANCYFSPARVRDALAAVPPGQRLIGMIDGESNMGGMDLRDQSDWDLLPGGEFSGPWGDNMTAYVSDRWGRWMAAFKEAGGAVDVITVDAEWSGWFIGKGFAAQRSRRTHQPGVWHALVADPRWPALRARLDAAGAPYGAAFANVSDMGTWALNDTADLRAHVWNAVMYERYAEVINASYFSPARAAFPRVKGSNYGHMYTPPDALWTFMAGAGEMHPPFAGGGAHVGTHQAKSFYPPNAAFRSGCGVNVGASSRMNFCWNFGTPFWERKVVAAPFDYAVLLWATTRVRGMVAANPAVPVMPWVAPKDSAVYPPGGSAIATSDVYQEIILHMALSGVREFLFWHAGPPRCCWRGCKAMNVSGCAWGTCPDPPSNKTESATVGVAALNAVLAEADAVAGVAGRAVLAAGAPPNPWDPFVLSGVALPAPARRRVYRFTPRGGAAVVEEAPATFRVAGVAGDVVPVPNGRLHNVTNPCSALGFWIIAPDDDGEVN